MKPTVALPSLASSTKPTAFQAWTQRQVVSMLSAFDRDVIVMTLPDGETIQFGETNAEDNKAEIHLHDYAFFPKIMLEGEVGFGEAFTEGYWSSPDLPRLLSAMIRNLASIPGMSGSRIRLFGFNLLQWPHRMYHLLRSNTKENSRKNIAEHYDLSNDFYQLWLDSTWTYSSAWFTHQSNSLEEAQNEKYDRLCRNLKITAETKVLEIGCGWGGFAVYCAKKYGAHVTAVTISEAQKKKAEERFREEGLENQIDLVLSDYRDLKGQYDAIVSIEMLEAVGHDYLPVYFAQCERLLAPEGRMGLQVIICPDARYEPMRKSVDWIKRHIFPGGQLPSIKAMLDATSRTGDLYLHHLENFGQHYATTLKMWRERFNQNLHEVHELGFDPEFVRKWNYYLAYCEAAFKTRNIDVSQCIFTRTNNEGFKPELG